MSTLKVIRNLIFLLLFIAVGLLAGIGAKSLYERSHVRASVIEGDYRYLQDKAGVDVLLFSTSTCPFCKQAKKFLAKHKIAYRDFVIDQSSEAKRLFEELGESGVPVVLVGNHLIRGYSPSDYEKLLAPAKRDTNL